MSFWLRGGSRTGSSLVGAAEAAQCLAPLRWLLDHAAGGGAALTATGNLARAVVAEGCHRFDWLTMTGNARCESDIPELMTLRDLAAQMGTVRRSGSRLRLTRHGRMLHAGGTDQLWNATMACLPESSPAQAAAGEIELMLLIDGQPLAYRDLTTTVAQALLEEGWRSRRSEAPIGSDLAAALLGRCTHTYGSSAWEPHPPTASRIGSTRPGKPPPTPRCVPGGYAPVPTRMVDGSERQPGRWPNAPPTSSGEVGQPRWA